MAKTYDEMNKEIVGILRMAADNPSNLYAARRIEELEQQRDELLAACELALEAICAGAEDWMLMDVETACRTAIANAKEDTDA